MDTFVSLRVKVLPNETNAAALHRAVAGIPFPLILANTHEGGRVVLASEAQIPLVDTRRFYDTYLVKYE